MEQMYAPPSQGSEPKDKSGSSKGMAEAAKKLAQGAPGKIISSSGLVIATLLSLLVGLSFVVRSLKNVKLSLRLKLKRDDKAEKKY